MIVKVRTSPTGSWKLYDGVKELCYSYFSSNTVIGVQDNVDDFTNPGKGLYSEAAVEKKEIQQIELWLNRGETINKQVLALSPVYVLNDEGKTIERL